MKTETSDESLTLFVRRWHPDTLHLGKFEEVTLESKLLLIKILQAKIARFKSAGAS